MPSLTQPLLIVHNLGQMGNWSVMCLDEISTGLDSAATLDIVQCLKAAAQAFGSTVAVSLLQPPPEVYALFDEVGPRAVG